MTWRASQRKRKRREMKKKKGAWYLGAGALALDVRDDAEGGLQLHDRPRHVEQRRTVPVLTTIEF
jgi:hypothetical protein